MAVDATPEGVDVAAMAGYLADTPVVYAILFGSVARGDVTSESDVDVALQFSEELTDRERFDARNRIDAELQPFAGGFVDVSDVEQLPVRVAARALREGQVFYGDESAAADDRRRFGEQADADEAERKRHRREIVDRFAEGRS